MEKDGLLILVQVDHLSAEDLSWVMEALCIPGVRNRNLLPTITKKGRVGHLLLLDIDVRYEADISRFIVEVIGSYGYHRIESKHVFQPTSIEERELVIRNREKELSCRVRLKKRGGDESGFFAIESDDLYAIVKRIRDDLGCVVSPMGLRRKIEGAVVPAPSGAGVQVIQL
ncbi:nickel insertion protein [Desulfomonile tiedjei]|uniref:nickel insertion protein n=1 Tax=Desulfomonile tiedjei TaxID=2358 RepID=UPI0002D5CD97|nr:nickel insertion protein [Desulfomonile tiedjei]